MGHSRRHNALVSFWEIFTEIKPMTRINLFVLTLSLLCVSGAGAATIAPTSYDMNNGSRGTFTYYDDKYDGVGDNTATGAELSGGLGDLTDGVIATDNWNVNPSAYVGWNNFNPTITFHFSEVIDFTSMTLYLDDSNGFGGVTPPIAVSVNPQSANAVSASISDPANGAPFAFTLDLSALAPTNMVSVLLSRRTAWIMLSEVEFSGVSTNPSEVPLPAAAWLFLSVLGGAGALRKFGMKAA